MQQDMKPGTCHGDVITQCHGHGLTKTKTMGLDPIIWAQPIFTTKPSGVASSRTTRRGRVATVPERVMVWHCPCFIVP